jgi:hypothetical protein
MQQTHSPGNFGRLRYAAQDVAGCLILGSIDVLLLGGGALGGDRASDPHLPCERPDPGPACAGRKADPVSIAPAVGAESGLRSHAGTHMSSDE